MSDDDIESWQKMYHEIWKVHHQLVFGMDGPMGREHSDKLFLVWEDWFFKLAPTEAELFSATEVLAGLEETFDAKWESHWSMVRRVILTARKEEAKKREAQEPERPYDNEQLPDVLRKIGSPYAIAEAKRLEIVKRRKAERAASPFAKALAAKLPTVEEAS